MSSQIQQSCPVFIVGCPRSGTSALAWSLAQHPDFWTSAESDFLFDFFGKGSLRENYLRAYGRPHRPWLKKHEVSINEFSTYIGLGIDQMFLSRSGNKRWIDATPTYTLMINDLALLFPNAKFLNIVRDGRAVVNSMINSGFDTAWAKDFKVACETWKHFVVLGVRAEVALDDRFLRIHHEELLHDTENVLQRIFQFLDAPMCPSSVDYLKTNRVNSSYDNKDKSDIKKSKNTDSLFQQHWKDWDNRKMKTFWKIAGDFMLTFGYPQSSSEFE